MSKLNTVTSNKDTKMYVIQSGNGYFSCLGFNVCIERRNALAIELDLPNLMKAHKGTLKAYNELVTLQAIARAKNAETGWKSKTGLTKQLIGLEGKRVEVVTSYGETHRFYVGKSTGFIPCHIEVKQRNSHGGGAVCGAPFKSVKVLYSK